MGEADTCMRMCMNWSAHVCAHPGTAARLLMVQEPELGKQAGAMENLPCPASVCWVKRPKALTHHYLTACLNCNLT